MVVYGDVFAVIVTLVKAKATKPAMVVDPEQNPPATHTSAISNTLKPHRPAGIQDRGSSAIL